jgi:hypothetical protein
MFQLHMLTGMVVHALCVPCHPPQVRDWLAARPERCIAVVSHWGCLYSMTGDHFGNCELRATRLSELLL